MKTFLNLLRNGKLWIKPNRYSGSVVNHDRDMKIEPITNIQN